MDVITLSYVNLLIGIAGVTLLLLLYKNDKSQHFLLFWLISSIALCINSALGIANGLSIEMPFWLLPVSANLATISIHVFILAAIYSQTNKPVKYHWIFGILVICFVLNNTAFAQQSNINRILINFPIMIALNLLSIRQLMLQPKSELSSVYYVLVFAFTVNIIQLTTRLIMLALYKLDAFADLNSTLVHSIGYYGLTTFAFLTLGACLYLVYKKHNILLKEHLERDPLTGAYNRRSMQQKIQTELERSNRSATSLSVIMLDIDHFKKVNDTLGHVAGDLAIQHVAAIAQKQLRSYDVMFRYGGEEFLICLPDTISADALKIADRLRKQVAQSQIAQFPDLNLTISIGIATTSDSFDNWQQLVQNADKALYQSKNQGRNQVWHYQELPVETQ